MNNDADPGTGQEGYNERKGGWAGGHSQKKYLSTLPSIPTQPTHPFSVSLENTLLTSGRGFYGETEAHQMGQHTFIALNILNSASPTLSVTLQHLISFLSEHWPV